MADDVYKLLIFLKRKAGASVEAFRRYYEERHIPVCLPYMVGPVRYRRSYLDPAKGAAEPEFDVVTELWFEDEAMRDNVLAALSSDRMPSDVIADEERFLDRSKSRFFAVTEYETLLEAAQK